MIKSIFVAIVAFAAGFPAAVWYVRADLDPRDDGRAAAAGDTVRFDEASRADDDDEGAAIPPERIEPERSSEIDGAGASKARTEHDAMPPLRGECELVVLLPDGSLADSADVKIRDGSRPPREESLAWRASSPTILVPLGFADVSVHSGDALRGGRSVRLHAGEAKRRLVVALSAFCELDGRLRFMDGPLSARAEVRMYPLPNLVLSELEEVARAKSQRSPRFSIRVEPGETTFRAENAAPGRWFAVVECSDLVLATRRFELAAGRNEVEIEVPPLPSERQLEVRVTDESGTPLHDVELSVSYGPKGTRGAGNFTFMGGSLLPAPDGPFRLITRPELEEVLWRDDSADVRLVASAPDHGTSSTAIQPGVRRYSLRLPSEPRVGYVVQVAGAANSPYRDVLDVVLLRRLRDRGHETWSGLRTRVNEQGYAVFDRVTPGFHVVELRTSGSSLFAEALLARQEVQVDAAHGLAIVELPELLELTVVIEPGLECEEVTVAWRGFGERSEATAPVLSDRSAIFRMLPAGRYEVRARDAKTTIELRQSTEVALGPDDVGG